MPSCWQVAMTRTAISPRLAMRTELNIVGNPTGAALLQESADALLALGTGAEPRNGGSGGLARIGVGELGDGARHELAGAHTGGSGLADGTQLSADGVVELVGGDDLVGEADGEGAVGVEALGSGEEGAGVGLADLAHDEG